MPRTHTLCAVAVALAVLCAYVRADVDCDVTLQPGTGSLDSLQTLIESVSGLSDPVVCLAPGTFTGSASYTPIDPTVGGTLNKITLAGSGGVATYPPTSAVSLSNIFQFIVVGGDSSASTVILQDLSIDHGHSTTSGGCVSVEGGADFTFTRVDFTECSAVVSGGAAYAESGSATFEQCGLASNHVFDGGDGGAVATTSSTLALTNCTFTYNSVQWVGGKGSAVSVSDSGVAVVDSAFIENECGSVYKPTSCGTVYSSGSTVDVSRSLFNRNYGSAINTVSDSRVSLASSAVTLNSGEGVHCSHSNISTSDSLLCSNGGEDIACGTGCNTNNEAECANGALSWCEHSCTQRRWCPYEHLRADIDPLGAWTECAGSCDDVDECALGSSSSSSSSGSRSGRESGSEGENSQQQQSAQPRGSGSVCPINTHCVNTLGSYACVADHCLPASQFAAGAACDACVFQSFETPVEVHAAILAAYNGYGAVVCLSNGYFTGWEHHDSVGVRVPSRVTVTGAGHESTYVSISSDGARGFSSQYASGGGVAGMFITGAELDGIGGAVHVEDNWGVFNLSGVKFYANSAIDGGAVGVLHSSVFVADCDFEANTASVGGADMWVTGYPVTLTGCSFLDSISGSAAVFIERIDYAEVVGESTLDTLYFLQSTVSGSGGLVSVAGLELYRGSYFHTSMSNILFEETDGTPLSITGLYSASMNNVGFIRVSGDDRVALLSNSVVDTVVDVIACEGGKAIMCLVSYSPLCDLFLEDQCSSVCNGHSDYCIDRSFTGAADDIDCPLCPQTCGSTECALHAVCTGGTESTSYASATGCECTTGFEGNGVASCDNVDECSAVPSACPSTLPYCMDTWGSFECYDGCVGGLHNCDPPPAGRCLWEHGTAMCECATGFTGNAGRNCDDIDECDWKDPPCPWGETCTNTAGSFTCAPAINPEPVQGRQDRTNVTLTDSGSIALGVTALGMPLACCVCAAVGCYVSIWRADKAVERRLNADGQWEFGPADGVDDGEGDDVSTDVDGGERGRVTRNGSYGRGRGRGGRRGRGGSGRGGGGGGGGVDGGAGVGGSPPSPRGHAAGHAILAHKRRESAGRRGRGNARKPSPLSGTARAAAAAARSERSSESKSDREHTRKSESVNESVGDGVEMKAVGSVDRADVDELSGSSSGSGNAGVGRVRGSSSESESVGDGQRDERVSESAKRVSEGEGVEVGEV